VVTSPDPDPDVLAELLADPAKPDWAAILAAADEAEQGAIRDVLGAAEAPE
jgi:hypothetical protein